VRRTVINTVVLLL